MARRLEQYAVHGLQWDCCLKYHCFPWRDRGSSQPSHELDDSVLWQSSARSIRGNESLHRQSWRRFLLYYVRVLDDDWTSRGSVHMGVPCPVKSWEWRCIVSGVACC